MVKIAVLIPCRDGESTLPRTLQSLLRQEAEVKIYVGNDASIDHTKEILRKYRKTGKVRFLTYPTREPRNYAKVPILFNMLHPIVDKADYYMVSGDDTEYPPYYIREVIDHMEKDGVSLASGYSVQYGYNTTMAPGGSGRIFKAKLFEKLTPWPQSITWETWALVKAQSMGYQIKAYPVDKNHFRPQTSESTWTFGHAAHSLRTPIVFTIFRVLYCIISRQHPPLNALCMLMGQIEYTIRRVPKLNDATHFSRLQKKRQLNRNIKTLLHKLTIEPARKIKKRIEGISK